MALLETLYGPNSVTTQTPGIDLPALPTPKSVDLSPLAALFFARRREQEQARRPQINMVQSRALAPQAEQSPWGGQGGMQDEAQMAALRRSIIENEQATMAAPRKLIFGPGIKTNYVMDPMAMNAAQRQAFLPKEASFVGGPTPTEIQKLRKAQGPDLYSDEARAMADINGWGMG